MYVKDRVVEVQCNSLAPLLTLLSCLPTTDPPLPSYHLKPLKLKNSLSVWIHVIMFKSAKIYHQLIQMEVLMEWTKL